MSHLNRERHVQIRPPCQQMHRADFAMTNRSQSPSSHREASGRGFRNRVMLLQHQKARPIDGNPAVLHHPLQRGLDGLP
jgi:hypothetical protein